MSIGIAYTGTGGSYNVVFRDFLTPGIPRQYEASASFDRTASGATVLGGPASRQKRIWTISAHLTPAKAQELDSMFTAWDADRSEGRAVACGLIDETFGATISVNVVFTTAPLFTYTSPSVTTVDFAVTEV